MKAFAGRDTEAARRLWEQDKMVDRGSYELRRDLMALLEGVEALPAGQHDHHIVERATCLLWSAHELERAGDHCTNICERIVFIVQGETDIEPPLEE